MIASKLLKKTTPPPIDAYEEVLLAKNYSN
jgi:hypothetical protein